MNVFVDHLGCLEDALCLVEVVHDAVLLLPGEIIRDGAGDHATGQAAALLGELFDPVTGSADLRLGSLVLAVQFGAQAVLDQLLDAGRDAHASPVAFDGRFDCLHVEVGLLAGGLALVPAEAEEVGIAALGQGEGQATVALPAEDRALEVVGVDTLLLTRHVMGHQHLLDLVEHRLGNERLVVAHVFGSFERHVAEVVPVGQHRGDVGVRERTAAARAAIGGNAAGGQGFRQRADSVLAGRIGLEGPLHVLRLVGVDHDDAYFASVDALPRVEITDGCLAGGAAGLGLLGHALEGFGRKVATVELGDSRHDCVQQLPGRSLVDVLLDRDQLRAVALQLEHRVGVVAAVAGEPVDLVEDDVVDVAG